MTSMCLCVNMNTSMPSNHLTPNYYSNYRESNMKHFSLDAIFFSSSPPNSNKFQSMLLIVTYQ